MSKAVARAAESAAQLSPAGLKSMSAMVRSLIPCRSATGRRVLEKGPHRFRQVRQDRRQRDPLVYRALPGPRVQGDQLPAVVQHRGAGRALVGVHVVLQPRAVAPLQTALGGLDRVPSGVLEDVKGLTDAHLVGA